MTNLEQLIEQLCPDGVEYRNIGSFATCTPGATPSTSKKEYWENGTIPWMSSGEVNLGEVVQTEKHITRLGYDNSSTKMIPADTVVIALAGQGKTRGKVAITRIPLCTNQSLCAIITDTTVMSKYLLHYLRSQYLKLRDISSGDGTRGGLNVKMIKAYQIPVPPLEVQAEIVRILDKFTELTTELTTELATELSNRKKQYEYYRNNLLTFNTDVEMKKLKDVSESIASGKNKNRSESGKYPVYGSTGIIAKTNVPVFSKKQILVARVGANAGYVHIADGEYDVSDNTLIIDIKTGYSIKYIYHYLVNRNLNQFAKGGGQPLITAGQLKELQLPVPNIEVQERIVNVLDNFEAICCDLNIGLPAEIEARQKQYEYYRDKLLSFKEVE